MNTLIEMFAPANEFLIKYFGEAWYERINTDALSMGSSTHCIIGQLHGHFNVFVVEHHLKYQNMGKLGFAILNNPFRVTGNAQLVQVWTTYIKLRRGLS